MTTKEFLIDQFTSNYDTDGWFVALGNTVKGLSAKDAAWKPDGVDNSIWGIVRHLNFYNERFLKRFKNEPVEELEIKTAKLLRAYRAFRKKRGKPRSKDSTV
jgi:DinB superfamily